VNDFPISYHSDKTFPSISRRKKKKHLSRLQSFVVVGLGKSFSAKPRLTAKTEKKETEKSLFPLLISQKKKKKKVFFFPPPFSTPTVVCFFSTLCSYVATCDDIVKSISVSGPNKKKKRKTQARVKRVDVEMSEKEKKTLKIIEKKA
jgi:hypothetical protein